MEINELQYQEFVKWKTEKKIQPNLTTSEVDFAKQIFEFLVDYPSFKNKIIQVGSKVDVFQDIQHYLKDKNK
jgi:hypothetical protein